MCLAGLRVQHQQAILRVLGKALDGMHVAGKGAGPVAGENAWRDVRRGIDARTHPGTDRQSRGTLNRSRIRLDRIVDFASFSDEYGITNDSQAVKTQSSKTGDGWFAYNLAVNLAKM